jgi:hypothetical protein
MNFNGTLFRQMAKAIQANGLQAAGYTLINVGGNGHAVNGSVDPDHSSATAIGRNGKVTNCTATKGCFIAARNSTGYYQIDAARFPGPGSTPACLNDTQLAICMGMGGAYGDGPNRDPAECGCVNGNEGMRQLANALREMGFQWGSYNAMGGCDNEACNLPTLAAAKAQGFVLQDYELFVEEWGSVYVMVDSVGDRDPQPAQEPKKPGDPSQGKYLLTEWSRIITEKKAKNPVILHSCHVDCSASYFSGPTLLVQSCNDSDPRQMWDLGNGERFPFTRRHPSLTL